MSGVILELQKEILSSECDIVNMLRKAHLIAVKLELREFDKWINSELNGYDNQSTRPKYRMISGELKAFNPYRGWITAQIPDFDLERSVTEFFMSNSLSELVSLCKNADTTLIRKFKGEQNAVIDKMFGYNTNFEYAVHVSVSSIMDIVEKVKNSILEWTLELEQKGIVGEQMKFDNMDKKKAHELAPTINYFGNTTVINSPEKAVQVVTGNNNTVEFSYSEARNIMDVIENTIESEDISAEHKEDAFELLKEIKTKIDTEQKPNFIKASLIGLKDFLVGIGASLTATAVQSGITQLFT